ncbi:hypothetical protein AEST_30390 [Alishewanella aestuarii B11]|uniref:Glycosyltransferase 2-like domain-containing protein n=1 Tax=Alishewanella aestuarii B11 TaxID=1197174 RepID=J1Y8X3_9ALTE|nr:glycosyltransferase family 2 protein [Alishewanella aestuarii]EJI84205.1 hypothetical protein AEST_30390 [Alishewanella aestuarii B11]
MTFLSIIIPLYNTEQYIAETLESVVTQKVNDIEVIVVDDASTDKGADVVRNYCIKYDWIRLVNNERSKGVSGARNTGINYANGAYITFLDSDDILLPNTLEKRIKLVKMHPEFKNFCWDYTTFEDGKPLDTKGKILGNVKINKALQSYKHSESVYIIENPVSFYLDFTCLMLTGTLIVQSKHVKRIGFFDESLTHCEDTDFWFKLSIDQKLLFSKDVSIGYRSRSGSASKDQEKIMLGIVQLRDRLLSNTDFHIYRKKIIDRRLRDVCQAGYVLRKNGSNKALFKITLQQITTGRVNIRLFKNLISILFGKK